MKKGVLILGSGISGLTLAWALAPFFEVTILEKNARAGGWLHTENLADFQLEMGARTFKASRCPSLLKLISDLGLEKELIFSSEEARRRYLWWRGKLHPFPSNPFSFLSSPLTRDLIPSFLKEWRIPAKKNYDESIWDFCSRRFSPAVAQRLFDPLTLGIYAGDIRKLSIGSCFPSLKKWEDEYGSLTKGLLKKRSQKGKTGLFSLKGGVKTLVSTLSHALEKQLILEQEVKSLRFSSSGVEVQTQNTLWKADYVVSALPAHVLGNLFSAVNAEIGHSLLEIPFEGITLVHLGYRRDILPFRGFGYLIPTSEEEEVLGTVFDSSIFPEQYRDKTCLTVMLRNAQRTENKTLEIALQAMKKHCGVISFPDFIHISSAPKAIPQYILGHAAKMDALTEKLRAAYPRLKIIGNYLHGVSVNDCVALAKKTAEEVLVQSRY